MSFLPWEIVTNIGRFAGPRSYAKLLQALGVTTPHGYEVKKYLNLKDVFFSTGELESILLSMGWRGILFGPALESLALELDVSRPYAVNHDQTVVLLLIYRTRIPPSELEISNVQKAIQRSLSDQVDLVDYDLPPPQASTATSTRIKMFLVIEHCLGHGYMPKFARENFSDGLPYVDITDQTFSPRKLQMQSWRRLICTSTVMFETPTTEGRGPYIIMKIDARGAVRTEYGFIFP